MGVFARRGGSITGTARWPRSLTASGERVTREKGEQNQLLANVQKWQALAFRYYDQVPEINYAAQFYSRILSSLELYPGYRNDDGEVERTEDAEAVAQLERVQDPGGGRTRLLSSYGKLRFLVGEAQIFCSRDPETEQEQWEALSHLELRRMGSTYMRFRAPNLTPENYLEASDEDYEPVDDESVIVYRLWNPHPAYCVDETTEILTEAGWRRHTDLRPGTRVLTLNHETGHSEWQPVQAVNRFGVTNEEMVSVEGAAHSSLTTLEHRWPTIHKGRNPSRRERYWTTSDRLNSNDSLITGAPCSELPVEKTFSDEFVEAVAWFYTEGNIARRYRSAQVSLCQSASANPEGVERIRRSLTALYGPKTEERMSTGSGALAPPKWREYQRPNSSVLYFWLNTAASAELLEVAPDKVVSLDFIRTLTADQLDLFIDTSVAADGFSIGHGSFTLAQKDPRRLAAFELACILVGRTPCFREGTYAFHDRSGNNYRMWSVRSSPKTTWHIEAPSRRMGPRGMNSVPTRQRYTGVVWCPTTRNASWLARRNGTVYYTGNSKLADCSMRAVLDVCEELTTLTQSIRAQGLSRLIQAGILLINDRVLPNDLKPTADDDPMADPILKLLIEAIQAAIKDPGSAAALAPILLRIETDDINEVMKHIRTVDPSQLFPEFGVRFESIKRLAIGLDLPPEILLGLADTNHWNAWMVDEHTWRMHGQPIADQFVGDLSSAFYRPTLRKEGVENWERYSIAYDATAVINHPDRGSDALDLFDRGELSGEATREAKGFDENAAPSDEERNRRLGVLIRDGSLIVYGIPQLRSGGIEPTEGEVETGDSTNQPGSNEVEKAPPAAPSEAEQKLAALEVEARLARILGACDVALHRARELAGNKLRSRAKRDPEAAKLIDGVPATEVAATLGRERAAALGAGSERELVAGGRELLAQTLERQGLDRKLAEPLADRIEQHVARHLWDEVAPPLPQSFGNYVAGLVKS